MVEYALLSASATLRIMATTANTWLADVSWAQVGYGAFGLITLWLLWRALTRPRAS